MNPANYSNPYANPMPNPSQRGNAPINTLSSSGGAAAAYGVSNSDLFNQFNTPMDTDYGTNGRVYVDLETPAKRYDLYQGSSENKADDSNFAGTLRYIQETTPLSQAYFTNSNIERVQQEIRSVVMQVTNADTDPILNGHKPILIGRQDNSQIETIMRSVYLQYAKHLDYNIDGQIHELNSIVIREAVPNIITNVKQYIGYIRDASSLPTPLEQPINTSSRGEKSYSLLFV
jgi:hypothetical protein